MERRLEPRVRCYQAIELRLLGQESCSIPGYAIQLSGSGMRLVVNRPVPVDAAVSVHAEDWMVLGEVCCCHPEEAHYAVGLQLDQTVMGLRSLDALRQNRLNERVQEPLAG